MHKNEKVLVFKSSLFEKYPNGFSKEADVYLDKIFVPNNLLFIDRDKAENDPTYKQLIPYCVFTNKVGVFVYQRTKKSGETRLHDKFSIGIGGHINPCDSDKNSKNSYIAGMRRELDEEVEVSKPLQSNNVAGVIYDNSNLVGRVHFGVVHFSVVDLNTDVKLKDSGLAGGEFWKLDKLFKEVDKFENWSQLVIKGLWS